MPDSSRRIVNKLWSYCHVLRDDGLSYLDYLEQLTFLLFLKMARERADLRGEPSVVPSEWSWPELERRDGDDLEVHYRHTLEALGREQGMLGVIFRKARNRIQDPAKLKRLISELIGREEWSSLDADVKGDAYEGLLEKNASESKGGAGQYFTPRSVIRAMVEVVDPRPGDSIADPACGTGGFLLAAHDHIVARHPRMSGEERRHLKLRALAGVDITDTVARLCAMNLLLHGIGPTNGDGEPPVRIDDSLREVPGEHFSVVLTNPPFGKKSSVRVITEEGQEERRALEVVRDDFWVATGNKQLAFVQHVNSLLETNGRAAVVVPDNVLFEGGAGETVRRKLLHGCDVHTLLRLPTGIFYAQGVKANVLFFEKRPGREEPWTSRLWVYDLRTNKHFTLKQNPLTRNDLDEFVALYNPENRHQREATWSPDNPEGRWRAYDFEELAARDKLNLDLFWIRDEALEETANLPEPELISAEIADDLRSALEEFEEISVELTVTE